MAVWPEAPATRMVDYIGPPGDGPPQQRAYKLRRKSIMAALTSGARSCWVQCPQPGSIIGGRSLGTSADCFAMYGEKAAATKSRSPAMYSAGTVTAAPAKGAINSQPRSMLRHQARGPWNPLRAYSLT